MHLVGSNGGYIDFLDDNTNDYDARIIYNTGVYLQIAGAEVDIDNELNVDEEITSDKTFQAGFFSNGGGGWQSATFPSAFDNAPIVVAVSGDDQNTHFFVRIRSITTTGFQYLAYNYSGSNHTGDDRINWIAMIP